MRRQNVVTAWRRARFQAARISRRRMVVEVDGIRFVVHTWDQGISRDLAVNRKRSEFRTLKRAVWELEQRNLSTCGVFVDVGANVGTACMPALLSHRFATAVAVEPESRNVLALREAAALNRLDGRLRIVQAAASETTGGACLAIRGRSGGHMVAEQGEPVETVTLDALIETASLVWVDVQGHEPQVLKGSSRLLAAGVPFVVEISSRTAQTVAEAVPGRIAVDLREHGTVDASDLAELCAQTTGRYTDVLLLTPP